MNCSEVRRSIARVCVVPPFLLVLRNQWQSRTIKSRSKSRTPAPFETERFVRIKAKLSLAMVGVAIATACSRGPNVDAVSVALVIVDTLRADHLGCYGSATPTPNLDQLARDGSIFLDATAHSPLTLPSHASILTGTTPLYHGIKDNGRYELLKKFETLAEMLKERGYKTAAFVGAYPVHSRFGLNQGFDIYDDSQLRARGEKEADEVVTTARDWLEQRKEGPFFLWVHIFDPHSPYEPPESLGKEYPESYGGEVAYVDDVLERLFSALGKNVLTVFTSDHGEGLGEHGEDNHALFIYDSTLRVPLILEGPGVPRGAIFKEQARSIDIVPTILDLVGLRELCDACQGTSLVPLMQGGDFAPVMSYAETFFPRLNLGWSELRSVRREGWKYITAPEPELYDLNADPKELENLAESEPHKPQEFARALAAIEERDTGPIEVSGTAPDQKTVGLLRSLGYVSSDKSPTEEGPLPDPKSRIGLWQSFIRGVEHSDARRFDDAIRELEAVLKEDSGMLAARGSLSEAYFNHGDYEAAAAQCRQYLESDPNDFQSTYLLAESDLRLGYVHQAVKGFEDAARLDPTSAGPLARLANLYLREGKDAKARELIASGLERDVHDAVALFVHGKLLMKEGKRDEAEKAFRDSLVANPREAAVRLQLANLLLEEKRAAEAESILAKSVAQEPNNPLLHFAMGRAQAFSGHDEKTAQSFQRSLDLNPNQPELKTLLEQYYAQ